MNSTSKNEKSSAGDRPDKKKIGTIAAIGFFIVVILPLVVWNFLGR